MKLAFSMPNLVQVSAMVQEWEKPLNGGDLTRLARLADGLGFGMIAVPEHFIIPNEHVALSGSHYFAAYPGMAYFAGATETIRVNSCISILPAQNPIITAKSLTTIDWLSGGRCMVTFAAGWLKDEFDLLRVPFNERGRICDEYVAAIIELWTSDAPEFEGKYVSFRDVAFEPKPVQKPHLPAAMPMPC
jgi:alkanesulfonate monooxygenase SsuD/methylene tetrahydromethanopterin reductase-like flavin-dependent oxidoreductase (luciferase family)